MDTRTFEYLRSWTDVEHTGHQYPAGFFLVMWQEEAALPGLICCWQHLCREKGVWRNQTGDYETAAHYYIDKFGWNYLQLGLCRVCDEYWMS